MIISYADKISEPLLNGKASRKLPTSIHRRAMMKLLALHSAINLDDLRIPPSNYLEKLAGDRQGQHSIRINNQYRICFKWVNGNAHDVEIVDYH